MSLFRPIAFFDPPELLDCSVTPVPASSSLPLQVIKNSGIDNGVGISYTDSTGSFIGVYTGNPGSEALACIIGGGVTTIAWGKFPPNSRVSLRSMTNAAVTNGQISASLVTNA